MQKTNRIRSIPGMPIGLFNLNDGHQCATESDHADPTQDESNATEETQSDAAVSWNAYWLV